MKNLNGTAWTIVGIAVVVGFAFGHFVTGIPTGKKKAKALADKNAQKPPMKKVA